MKAKKNTKPALARPDQQFAETYRRIQEILESAKAGVARTVNTTQVVANWLIGREIVEEEQRGSSRAGYGEALVLELSARLNKEYGAGYSKDNLFWFRRFYAAYPHLLKGGKFDALRQISVRPAILDAVSQISDPPRRKLGSTEILHTLHGESDGPDNAKTWEPGRLSLSLSWTHY